MPDTNGSAIPLRQFGPPQSQDLGAGLWRSSFIGDAPDERTAVRLVKDDVDGGMAHQIAASLSKAGGTVCGRDGGMGCPSKHAGSASRLSLIWI
jgi:hypothetical protein